MNEIENILQNSFDDVVNLSLNISLIALFLSMDRLNRLTFKNIINGIDFYRINENINKCKYEVKYHV